MLYLQDAPVAHVEPAEDAQATLTVAASDRPIAIKVKGALEQDVVRYQLFVNRNTTLKAAPPAPGATEPAALVCSWRVTSAMQWQICSYTRSGIFMCTASSDRALPDAASGSVSLPPGPDAMAACGYDLPALRFAVDQLRTKLKGEADEMINADVRLLSAGLGKKAGRP